MSDGAKMALTATLVVVLLAGAVTAWLYNERRNRIEGCFHLVSTTTVRPDQTVAPGAQPFERPDYSQVYSCLRRQGLDDDQIRRELIGR
jgi:hypothetical protein